MSSNFPNKQHLWQGAVLGGIVNAVMTAESDLFALFRHWEDKTYVVNGMDGRMGAIVFENGWSNSEGWMVGVFYDQSTARNSHILSDPIVENFFLFIPDYLQQAATEAIAHHMTDKSGSRDIRLVTNAFWSEGRDIVSTASWASILNAGGSLIENETHGAGSHALENWQVSYGMSALQSKLAQDLYQLRIANEGAEIEISEEIARQIRQGSISRVALDSSQGLFADLGMYFPPEGSWDAGQLRRMLGG